MAAHKGWTSRNYLPHCDAADLIQHIVFGLADAAPERSEGENVHAIEAWFDAGHGACLLKQPACAEIMEETLLHDDGVRYRLIAWCIMPSHVHVVLQQMPNHPLGGIVQTWKSVSARRINRETGESGALWRRDYFDRFMRDDDHLAATIAYVESNPVAARLALRAQDWGWGSARLR